MKILVKSALALLSAAVLTASVSAAEAPAAPAKGASALPAPLERAARRLKIDTHDVVISVVPVDAPDRPALAWNDARKDRPASVAKLVTTLAALETLGAHRRWYTSFYTKEKPSADGVLKGNLYIRGSGDPSFVVEDFAMELDRLERTGIRRIEGNVVIDRSHFDLPDVNPSAFDGRGSRPYNLQPDPTLFNYRNLSFEFIPDRAAGIARVVPVPRLAGVEMPETIPLGKGACGDWKTKIGFKLRDLGGGRKRAVFNGSLPASCGAKNFNVIAFGADEYFDRLFRALWVRDGRAWTGRAVSGRVPADAERRLTHPSAPLGEVVQLTNKWSNNLMARHIFLALGADRVRDEFDERRKAAKKAAGGGATAADGLEFPRGATLGDSRAALADWLRAKRVDPKDVWVDNGSGLSRETRVTGRAMTKILVAGWNGPYMPEYLASMPISGRDGTMAKRRVAVEEGRIKTGFLADVRSIGGYVHAKDGRRYAVYASVRGGKNVPNGIAFLDRVIDWVYRRK